MLYALRMLLLDVTESHMKSEKVVKIEERTARLTILIDPRKKSVLERLCAEEDLTPSQVVRRREVARPAPPSPVPGGGSSPGFQGRPSRCSM